MAEKDQRLFTIGVFQDLAWAERGLDALKQQRFAREALSIISRETAETAALVERALGGAPARLTLPRLGPVVATGSLVAALDGAAGDLAKLGLAAAMTRVGFQTHDGQIFEALTGKGGVLVGVEGEPRAADALAVMHSFGGANAAIGAWSNRV
ncbi:MAG: hypothetical protein ACM3NQ_05785 [Bacteroidales bacterium]